MHLETYEYNPYRLLRRSIPVTISPVEDARFEDLGKALGVNIDFADLVDADPVEIRERQGIFKWLLQNTSLSADFFTHGYDSRDGSQTLPDQSRDFMKYQHLLEQADTNFWRRVAAFQEVADRSLYQLPGRVNSLSQALTREGQIQYEEEVGLVSDMLAELRRLAQFEGTLEFQVDTTSEGQPVQIELTPFLDRVPKLKGLLFRDAYNVRDLACYGLWTHHEALDPHRLEIPVPLSARFLRRIKFKGWAEVLESRQKVKLVEPAQIKRTPKEIAQDVADYLNKLFAKKNGFELDAKFRLRVFYRFGAEGLSVTFLSWELCKSYPGQLTFAEPEFDTGHLRHLSRRFANKRNKVAKGYWPHRVYAELNDWLMEYTTSHAIDSPLTDAQFCHQRFSSVYLTFKTGIEKVMAWQNQVTAALDDLVLWRNIAVAIDKADTPYYYPEIDTQTARLEATNAYPIRLRRIEGVTLVPFSAVSLNGQIVNLGGKNNSGKSTAMLTDLDIQTMGQSGLPVFAKSGVVVYPRQYILLSFLDRSSDKSTYMAKLIKDHEVINLINSVPLQERKSVLVIVDELGSGTDQHEVLEVVQPFLDWLCQQQVSVLTSTQIRAVSDYIASSCGGENFVINPDYGIKKGVGSPRPRELAESIGFFESMKLVPPQ
jgi:hypothetical protein